MRCFFFFFSSFFLFFGQFDNSARAKLVHSDYLLLHVFASPDQIVLFKVRNSRDLQFLAELADNFPQITVGVVRAKGVSCLMAFPPTTLFDLAFDQL